MAADYTLILGTKNLSSWSLRAYLALRATNAPFEEVLIRLLQPKTKAELLKYSPAGKVPVLQIYEHKHIATVWDILASCETLAERHPEARLWPVNPTKRLQARSYAAEMHSGFSNLRDQLPMDFVRKHPLPELTEGTKADIARIIEAWSTALVENGQTGKFLFGAYSIADILYAPVVSRFLSYGVPLPATIESYCHMCMALPAMRDWMAGAKAEVDSGIA